MVAQFSPPTSPSDRICLFDTTLRDGLSQLSLTTQQRLEIALALARMGVDVIEGGYSLNGKQDLEGLKVIAAGVTQGTICGLAADRTDVDAVGAIIGGAKQSRLNVFASTAVEDEEGLERLLAGVRETVSAAKSWGEVQWTAMDAWTSSMEMVERGVRWAIASGATTIVLADTTGRALPEEVEDRVTQLRIRVPELVRVVLGVHFHNQEGWAVENSLAALEAGARQVEASLEGVGGNTNLLQLGIGIRDASRCGELELDLDFELLERTSQMISRRL